MKKTQKEKETDQNKPLYRVMYVFVALFLLLSSYLCWFLAVDAREIINNPYNLRQSSLANKIIRGSVLGADGEILAQTIIEEDGTEMREYPYANLFAHVVGYSQNGKTGIEKMEDYNLLTSDIPFYEKIYQELVNQKSQGNQITTTLDVSLQQTAYDALGDRNGAVVVLEPSTGKILAMVSKPDYNPNDILDIWDSLVADDSMDSSLLNRTTQGLYPPGSIFKILTALAYIRENPENYNDYFYQCTGIFSLNNAEIKCYHGNAHGDEDLRKAFAKSCNGAFARIGSTLSITSFRELCNTFLFNQELPVSLAYSPSIFSLNEEAPTWEILQTSIGQGMTEMTPFHSALITSAIANGGVLMKPYLVASMENAYGEKVKSFMPTIYGELMTPAEAGILTSFLTSCVTEGTAAALSTDTYTAAGKTGTAEWDDKRETHAWFTGFAPAENPQVVVSVLVEEAGTGSDYAVPVAKKIFDAYLGEK